MLRNRSRRAVSAKQASLMADQPPSSRTQIAHFTKPTLSSLFSPPKFKLFSSLTTPFDSDYPLISPTSILDANPSIFSGKNDKPDSYFEPTIPKPQRFQPPEASGLADLLETASTDDNRDSNGRNASTATKPLISKMVLFGSKLPSADFGTKSGGLRYPGQGQGESGVQTRVLTGCCISVREMVMSEEYTCVISHGPNPTTRHIFDNCVYVESNHSAVGQEGSNDRANHSVKMNSFLNLCYTCKKNLDQRHDIYIYRGEKSFCSRECRYQEMLIDQMES